MDQGTVPCFNRLTAEGAENCSGGGDWSETRNRPLVRYLLKIQNPKGFLLLEFTLP